MNAQDLLRYAIDAERERLRSRIPSDRQTAILALLRLIDALPFAPSALLQCDLFTGRPTSTLGASLALQLCLEATDDTALRSDNVGHELEAWVVRYLDACARLCEAELVLSHAETGFMRLVTHDDGTLAAWVATKQTPASWRERADTDWWAAWLARRHERELQTIESASPPANGGSIPGQRFRQLARVHLGMMAYQIAYPADAVIGGCTMQTYRLVLGALIARALWAHDRGKEVELRSAAALIDTLVNELRLPPEMVARALRGFTLNRENAAYHAAPQGAALPPLVELAPDRVICSIHGLLGEPFFFLFRELRRRDAQDYHNSAFLREGVFRDDLYELFVDKRFVTSSGRIVLRRDVGDVRTDIDAAVFDRKSGALALFELKSHDPFARTTAELSRQRDNVLYANRQIGGVLDWIKRHGADEILNRLDRRAAKTFRVQKVYPFVLGRYLVQFNDGPVPDRRAAWGTWPQVLRLRDGQPFGAGDANPIGTCFTQMRGDAPLIAPPADQPPREITVGPTKLIIYPSFSALRGHLADAATADSRPS